VKRALLVAALLLAGCVDSTRPSVSIANTRGPHSTGRLVIVDENRAAWCDVMIAKDTTTGREYLIASRSNGGVQVVPLEVRP